MKKIVLLRLLLCPIFVEAIDCSKETINELKDKARAVEFNIEYSPSNDVDNSDVYFNISSPNLGEDFLVTFKGEPYMSYIIMGNSSVLIKGGVYDVEFISIKCDEQAIYSYNMMIPYYAKDNKNVWFDGTYEEVKSNERQERTTKKGMNILFISVCAAAFILIITISLALVKKRRKIK